MIRYPKSKATEPVTLDHIGSVFLEEPVSLLPGQEVLAEVVIRRDKDDPTLVTWDVRAIARLT